MSSLTTSINNKAQKSSPYSDLFLAVAVIAIVSIMILPLPLILLDTLVAINISMGVILVLMAIYVSSPLQFSVFPSVLLISTLFRLSLSVATTRMILLHADAGNIIDTFGQTVAGGNIVVGLVVFLIITLVQFIVIAKGAERVAEVGARFTLDAMPGKQMSIDSDLRSGLIDKQEARSKRDEIELESKLHGSMDGAMKFVKGDAIAGIVIIIINLLGGLMIGVFQRDLAVGAAMHEYSILTIGDGMVTQIPALLGAMSAGLIVTRVTDDSAKEHLGDSIMKQFTAIPRVLLVAGAMCVMFGLVPGFPSGVFITLGLLLLGSGALLVPALKARMVKASRPTFESVMTERAKQARQTTVAATPVVANVEYSSALSLRLPYSVSHGGRDEALRQSLTEMIEQQSNRLGMRFPQIEFDWSNTEKERWTLTAYEAPIATAPVGDDQSIVDGVLLALRKNAGLFIGMQETRTLLAAAAQEFPDIVKEVERVLPIQDLASVIRGLVEEEIPIKNVRGVLEAIAITSANDKDPKNLVEHVRIALSRQISHKFAPNGELRALTLDNGLQGQLIEALRSRAGSDDVAVDPQLIQTIRENSLKSIAEHTPDAMVVKVPLRRHLRTLLSNQAFDLPVLSFEELDPGLSLNLVASVEA